MEYIWISTITGRNMWPYENGVRTAIFSSEAEAYADLKEWAEEDNRNPDFDFSAFASDEEAVETYFQTEATSKFFGVEQSICESPKATELQNHVKALEAELSSIRGNDARQSLPPAS